MTDHNVENWKTSFRNEDVGGSVTFLNQIPYDEIPRICRRGDVFVLPSQTERVPRTIMDALASGVSIVITDLLHFQSTFGSTISYLSADDIETMSNQIIDQIAISDGPFSENPSIGARR